MVAVAVALFVVGVGYNNHAEGELSFPVIGSSIFGRYVIDTPEGVATYGKGASDFEVWVWDHHHPESKVAGYLSRSDWEIRQVSDLDRNPVAAEKRAYCKR